MTALQRFWSRRFGVLGPFIVGTSLLLVAGKPNPAKPPAANPPGKTPPSGKAPPSGKVKESADAQVTFKYQRKKITECRWVQEDGERYCDSGTVNPEAGGSMVQLTPIDEAGELDGQRVAVDLEFPKQSGEQTREITLRPGRWEIVWKDGGGIAKDRFFTVAKDKFEIALETISGYCAEEAGKCQLQASKVQQSIELPEPRGVR